MQNNRLDAFVQRYWNERMRIYQVAFIIFICVIMATPFWMAYSASAETNNGVDANEWPTISALGLSNSEMLSIFYDYEESFESYPEDYEESLAYEEEVSRDIAQKYGITPDQADMVYGYVLMNFEEVKNNGEMDTVEYNLRFGELVSVNKNGSIVVIKAKIHPVLDNDLTIKQNYFNVCDLIKNQGLNIFDEVQYWAIADTVDGQEIKVISFTVPKDTIELVTSDRFPENLLGDYVEDLWILPSLRE